MDFEYDRETGYLENNEQGDWIQWTKRCNHGSPKFYSAHRWVRSQEWLIHRLVKYSLTEIPVYQVHIARVWCNLDLLEMMQYLNFSNPPPQKKNQKQKTDGNSPHENEAGLVRWLPWQSICFRTWWPEFDPQYPQGGGSQSAPAIVVWSQGQHNTQWITDKWKAKWRK